MASILNAKDRIQFFVPDYLIEEIKEHLPNVQEYLKKKSLSKTKRQILSEFKKILHGITVVPIDDIKENYVSKAKKLVQDIDPDELSLKNGLIIKGYGHFFISTAEIKAKLYKKIN